MTAPVLPGLGQPIEVDPSLSARSYEGVLYFEAHSGATESGLQVAISRRLETLEILADPEMVQAIAEGDEAVAHGDVVDLEDFRRTIEGLRGQQRD